MTRPGYRGLYKQWTVKKSLGVLLGQITKPHISYDNSHDQIFFKQYVWFIEVLQWGNITVCMYIVFYIQDREKYYMSKIFYLHGSLVPLGFLLSLQFQVWKGNNCHLFVPEELKVVHKIRTWLNGFGGEPTEGPSLIKLPCAGTIVLCLVWQQKDACKQAQVGAPNSCCKLGLLFDFKELKIK